ncbi:hypothetical protein ACP70R_036648 [Stipagrostis hirtigluma subsp. patula]
MDSQAVTSLAPVVCVRIDPCAMSTLIFPFGCGIVRSFDRSHPIAIHNSGGCITLFEWKAYASGKGRHYLDVGWKEYCSDFRVNVGDTCMFTNMGRHNVSLLVQDETGAEKKPSSCLCTVGLGHKKVILCSAQTAALLDKYCYVSRSVYVTPEERQRLALLAFVSPPKIPFYVFQHKARLYLNGWMRMQTNFSSKYLPATSTWCTFYYASSYSGIKVWYDISSGGKSMLTTGWSSFCECNNLVIDGIYVVRFNVAAGEEMVAFVDPLSMVLSDQ